MFRLPGFKIGSPSKQDSALSSVKTKSMTELAELLRNKHSKGQDPEEEEEEKKSRGKKKRHKSRDKDKKTEKEKEQVAIPHRRIVSYNDLTSLSKR